MQAARILAAEPDDIIDRHEAMRLLGLTRYESWQKLVRDGDIAIFQRGSGPNAAKVQMRTLQDYVRRLSARAEEERLKRFRAAQRRR